MTPLINQPSLTYDPGTPAPNSYSCYQKVTAPGAEGGCGQGAGEARGKPGLREGQVVREAEDQLSGRGNVGWIIFPFFSKFLWTQCWGQN